MSTLVQFKSILTATKFYSIVIMCSKKCIST